MSLAVSFSMSPFYHGRMPLSQFLRDVLDTVSAGGATRLRPPALLTADGLPVGLRPLYLRDEGEWNEVRWRNDSWLEPWESEDPTHGPALDFAGWVRRMRRDERQGRGVTFAIVHGGAIVGQISLGAIAYGSMRTGIVGYWVDREWAGHGFAPAAVAMLADWAFADGDGPRLHRLEIAIMPENARSLAVARAVGARYEGRRPRYMYVAGDWRDHETFCLLAEDRGDGFARRLARAAALRHAEQGAA